MDIDINEVFKQVIGPLGGYVLLGLFFLGFAWSKPWFYFAREVDFRRENYEREVKERDIEIVSLKSKVYQLEQQSSVLLAIANSGTQQGSQVALLARSLAELTTGNKIIVPELGSPIP